MADYASEYGHKKEREERMFPVTGERLIKISDGEPCYHKGCSRHFSHPCEVCERTSMRGDVWIVKEDRFPGYASDGTDLRDFGDK